MSTLYEQIGGAPAVNAAVDLFYRKVLGDTRVNYFFDDVDMGTQITKQKSFLTFAFGGPNAYTGKDLRQGHKHLLQRGLNDSHFDIIAGHLKSTLDELSVPGHLVDQVCAIAESTRSDVLGH